MTRSSSPICIKIKMCNKNDDQCHVSYEEEDTRVAYEEEDTCVTKIMSNVNV